MPGNLNYGALRKTALKILTLLNGHGCLPAGGFQRTRQTSFEQSGIQIGCSDPPAKVTMAGQERL